MAQAYYNTSSTGTNFVALTPDMVGAAAANHTHNLSNLVYFGANPLSSSDEDTVEFWGAKGFGFAFISQTGLIKDQPSQYGYILNITLGGSEVHQLWMTQASGVIGHRGGNIAGWSGSWKWMADTSNSEIVVSSSQPTNQHAKLWIKV